MTEKMIQANGIELWTETFGNPADPALLLIMGATASMAWWPEPLCRQLADGGRFVIRYDNRDTGQSTSYPAGTLAYSLDDMADDALGVLDAYGIARAHLVGMSLGGMLAQLLAMRNPERVLTLTIMSSTPYGPVEAELPGMDEGFLAHAMKGATLDWTDEQAVVDHSVEGWRLVGGSGHVFDAETTRATSLREFRRARSYTSMNNHALLESVPLPERDMGAIAVPTLVIHGTEDPVLPLAHGEAIARAIPGARLLTLAGTGHELHRDDWPRITEAILGHPQ